MMLSAPSDPSLYAWGADHAVHTRSRRTLSSKGAEKRAATRARGPRYGLQRTADSFGKRWRWQRERESEREKGGTRREREGRIMEWNGVEGVEGDERARERERGRGRKGNESESESE
eukprot:724240-Rhodomonas_salina.2